jgi:predicted chitinase
MSKPLISVAELHQMMPQLPSAKAAQYAPLLSAAMLEHDIISRRRRCAFVAQLAHESCQLKYMEEIASGAAYEGRADLGNTQPGDGRRFKGRGPIQLTGRANYRRFGRLLGLDLEAKPHLAAEPVNGFRIAALYWKLGGLNELADHLSLKGDDVDVGDRAIVKRITKRINGGTNGLADRVKYFKVAKQVLHGEEHPTGVAPTIAPAEPIVAVPSAAVNAEALGAGEPANEPDLVTAALTSEKAKGAGLKLWPRLVKHGSAIVSLVYAVIEAHKVASILVAVVLLAALAWVVYHNRKPLKLQLLKLLK